jgi:predicted transcriptional regulator
VNLAATTTIRLPPALKLRVAAAAAKEGSTAHSFILEAIAEKTERAGLRDEFDAEADRRAGEVEAGGATLQWEAVRGYVEARLAAGKRPRRPVAKKRKR